MQLLLLESLHSHCAKMINKKRLVLVYFPLLLNKLYVHIHHKICQFYCLPSSLSLACLQATCDILLHSLIELVIWESAAVLELMMMYFSVVCFVLVERVCKRDGGSHSNWSSQLLG